MHMTVCTRWNWTLLDEIFVKNVTLGATSHNSQYLVTTGRGAITFPVPSEAGQSTVKNSSKHHQEIIAWDIQETKLHFFPYTHTHKAT